MDCKLEEIIVKLFFQKHKIQRILWELSSAKKRKSALKELHALRFLNSKIMQPIQYYSEAELEKILSELSDSKISYYMGEEFTGILPLNESLKRSRKVDEGCIIYCGKGIGYCHGDHEEGTPQEYILRALNYADIERGNYPLFPDVRI